MIKKANYSYFFIFNFEKYLLIDSILFNLYRAIYLVNDINKFEPESVKKISKEDIIAAGVFYLPIITRGIWKLMEVLKGPSDIYSNSILNNIMVISEFFINIISELYLYIVKL